MLICRKPSETYFLPNFLIKNVQRLICLLIEIKYFGLSSYYVLGILLIDGNTSENQIDKSFLLL